MPMPLQLALQGGGARLIALLAAMEAVEELEGKEVKVTRLCGTSAGAIVACLYAAGIKMQVAKTELENHFRGKISEWFPAPGNMKFAWKIYRRSAIWSPDSVKTILEKLFAKKVMKDLKPAAAVVVSDLTRSSPVTYSSWDTETRDTPVVWALLHSIALPFFFRVWNDTANPVLVDGGICNNMPSSVLLDQYPQEPAEWGNVYALSFPPDTAADIESAKDFAFALVNTAIDAAIKREKARLAGRVHEIRTNLTTLDFEKALKIEPAEYQEIKGEAAEFFRNHANGSGTQSLHEDLWKEQNLALLHSLWRVFEAQTTGSYIQYQSSRVVWLARGLKNPQDPDDLHVWQTFKVGSSDLQWSSIRVLTRSPSVGQMEFSVLKVASAEAVPYEILPARDPDKPLSRALLFHYRPALPAGSGPYKLYSQQAIRDFCKKLREEKTAPFTYTEWRADGAVGMFELVIQVPEDMQLTFEPLEGVESSWEVLGSADFVQLETPQGFKPYGLRVRDWPGERKFGVKLRLA